MWIKPLPPRNESPKKHKFFTYIGYLIMFALVVGLVFLVLFLIDLFK